MDVEAILQNPISFKPQGDFWAWHHERSGIFSVRSAYHMIIDTKIRRENYFDSRTATSNTEGVDQQWKKLWKVKVSSRLRIFPWRLARASLPTGEVRVHRHMATSPICSVCNTEVDTRRHSLLECNMARAVWAMREDDLLLPLYGDETTDPKLWIFNLSSTLN